MIALLHAARKSLSALLLLLTFAALTACVPSGNAPRIDASKPIPVALLVPGGSAEQGDALLAQGLENAARLAIVDLQGVKIDLRVYNTAGRPDQAAQVAVQAVNDGAKIILGPVYAASANAVGLAVADRGVNVLAFSNNPAIAGGNVFILGPTFQNTANRLISYAAAQGKGSVFVVNGQGGAEQLGRDAALSAISQSRAQLAGTGSFPLSQQGVVSAVPQIVADAKASGATSIFLTSGNDGALPLLAQLLPEAGLSPASIQYIGLQRWDVPASALALPGLQGGWFALPDQALTNQFGTRYGAAYGGPPLPIAGLAYDGIAAIGALVQSGQGNALTASALTRRSGFAGVNGIFRLLSDGTNERALAVATISNNQVVEIDPAPRSFGSFGF